MIALVEYSYNLFFLFSSLALQDWGKNDLKENWEFSMPSVELTISTSEIQMVISPAYFNELKWSQCLIRDYLTENKNQFIGVLSSLLSLWTSNECTQDTRIWELFTLYAMTLCIEKS